MYFNFEINTSDLLVYWIAIVLLIGIASCGATVYETIAIANTSH